MAKATKERAMEDAMNLSQVLEQVRKLMKPDMNSKQLMELMSPLFEMGKSFAIYGHETCIHPRIFPIYVKPENGNFECVGVNEDGDLLRESIFAPTMLAARVMGLPFPMMKGEKVTIEDIERNGITPMNLFEGFESFQQHLSHELMNDGATQPVAQA